MATREQTAAKEAEARRLVRLGSDARNANDFALMEKYWGQAAELRGQVGAEAGRQDFGDLVTSGKNAIRNVSENVQGVMSNYGGVMGIAFGDTLGRINAKKESFDSVKAEQAIIDERSPRASMLGKGLGEAAVTLPFAGTGAAVRSTMAAAESGVVRSILSSGAGLSAEGAAVGAAVSEDGNAGRDAAIGAVANPVVGGLFNRLTTMGGQTARNLFNRSKVDDMATSRVARTQLEMDEAMASGGYKLDPLTADHSVESISMRDQVKANEDTKGAWLLNDAEQERDVAAKATEFATQDGLPATEIVGGGIKPMERVIPKERRLKEFKEGLDSVFNSDKAEYQGLYKEADELAKANGVSLDLSVIKNTKALRELMADPSMENRGSKDVYNGIMEDFKKYGLVDSPDGATKPLTFENSEHLVQSLNSMMKYDGSAGDRLLVQAKQSVMKSIDETLEASGLDSAVVAKYRQAASSRRAFNSNWEQGDLIGNVVNVKRTVEDEFKLDYAKILGSMNRESVKKVKAKIGLGSKNPEAWLSLRQAPLLEALAAGSKERVSGAVGNTTKFNDTAFFNALDKYSIEVQEELWGKEVVDNLTRARSAWLKRDRKIDAASSANPSGTAATAEMLRAGRFVASGWQRNVGMVLNTLFGDRLQHNATNAAAGKATRQAIGSNEIPSDILDESRTAMLEQFERDYLGTNKSDAMRTLQSAFRLFTLSETLDKADTVN